jgi:uncharacterized membrane protein YphA (DoxX/SURF4 family)
MLYAAINKLMDYNLSREQMALMPFLTPFAYVLAWLLPAIEIAVAILLFLPKTRLKGLYLVTALMLFFTTYIVFMMINYKNLPCSCGGFLNVLSWPAHLFFNGLFILLGVFGILLSRVTRNFKGKEYYLRNDTGR